MWTPRPSEILLEGKQLVNELDSNFNTLIATFDYKSKRDDTYLRDDT